MFNNKINSKGFTLIELMVAVAVFSVVMVLFLGSILSVFDGNQKSKTLRSVMDNLDFTLESMTREIRFGRNYHCGTGLPLTTPVDCAGGNANLTIRNFGGSLVSYSLAGGRITRTINSGTTYNLTSPDITITNLSFRVYGSPPFNGGTDLFQPQVIIVIGGYVGTKLATRSTFSIETTVSQRTIDSQ